MPRLVSPFAFACALACLAPTRARAEGPQQLAIATAGACPTAEQVNAELLQLLPDAKLEITSDVVDSDVIVADRGTGFTVKVRGQRRRFRDLKRDCLERARHVAVFTVLIVDPLHVPTNVVSHAEEEPEPALTSETTPDPRPLVTPTSTTRSASSDLSLGPVAQVAIPSEGASTTTQAGGLGLRFRYGSSVGVAFGLAGLLPTSLHFQQVDARATWAPMDLSLSLSQRSNSWVVSFDIGVTGAVLFVEGQGKRLDTTELGVRFELGGRAGLQVRYWASERAGLYFGMAGSLFPKPYTLQVENLGTVGQTPTAWISGSTGAVIRL